MELFVHLESDNVIILKSDKSELSLEFADRTQENIFLTKREVDELIKVLTMHQEEWNRGDQNEI